MNNVIQKKYLPISDVARKFGISVEVLRKWENDFPRVLKPYRTKGGTRLYDEKSIEQVALIHRLLTKEGLTIQGAKRKLQGNQSTEEKVQQVITKLTSIKQTLLSMVHEIDNINN